MNNLNLNNLKYFYEVVNEKNITKASSKLNVSQPAVTKAIHELEKEINAKLLERSKKGVIPTPEGLILYEHTKEILDNIDRTINIIDTNKDSKYLYIGATTTNFTIFIKDALMAFRKDNPNIHISIVLESLEVLNDMARLNKLDILIKNSYEEFNNFKEIKTFEIQDRFIASRKYFKELENKTYSFKELSNYPFVLLSNITHGRRNFDNYLKENKIEFKPTYEFNSYSLCRELILEGFGIGIGNPIHYNSKDYIIINTSFNLPKRIFNIGYVSNNELIEKFIKYI